MMPKDKKSRQELTAMVMKEIRQHHDWNDIVDVAIIQPVQSAPHHPNWDAAFTMHGQLVPPDAAFQIVRELQNKYDLAGN